jgi:hypothetical protein
LPVIGRSCARRILKSLERDGMGCERVKDV